MNNYQKAYKELKDLFLNLKPYCDNCLGNTKSVDADEFCDDCHRKCFYWEADPDIINNLEEKYNIKQQGE